MPMVFIMGIRRAKSVPEATETEAFDQAVDPPVDPPVDQHLDPPVDLHLDPAVEPSVDQPGASARPRPGVARVLLALFLVVGLGAAVGATWQWKTIKARQNRQAFDQRASGVAARVTKTLQRDTDLTTTSRALIEQNPDLTNAQLGSWFSSSASSAPTNTTGVAYIEKVSAAQLYYFRVAIDADPTSALSAGESFAVTPTTAQAPYCLTRLLALRSSATSAGDIALPPGLDWCSTSAAGALVDGP